MQEGRGHLAVYYTCPQGLMITFKLIRWLNNIGDFYWIFIGWFIKLGVQMFQPLIEIYRRGDILCIMIEICINLSAIVLSLKIPGGIEYTLHCIALRKWKLKGNIKFL